MKAPSTPGTLRHADGQQLQPKHMGVHRANHQKRCTGTLAVQTKAILTTMSAASKMLNLEHKTALK